MQSFEKTLSEISTLVEANVQYPGSLTKTFDLKNDFDSLNFDFLTNKNGVAGYYPWLKLLAANSDAKLIVELGNRYGVSTVALFAGMKENQTLISIDIVKDQRYVTNEMIKDERIKLVWGDCLNLKTYLDHNIDIPIDIDILWTDTIHYYDQVKAEYDVYEPLLADEALIIIDDIRVNDKGRFYNEITHSKQDLTELCHSSGFGAIFYKRHEKERGKSKEERILQSLLQAGHHQIKQKEKLEKEIEQLKYELQNTPYKKIARKIPKPIKSILKCFR